MRDAWHLVQGDADAAHRDDELAQNECGPAASVVEVDSVVEHPLRMPDHRVSDRHGYEHGEQSTAMGHRP